MAYRAKVLATDLDAFLGTIYAASGPAGLQGSFQSDNSTKGEEVGC